MKERDPRTVPPAREFHRSMLKRMNNLSRRVRVQERSGQTRADVYCAAMTFWYNSSGPATLHNGGSWIQLLPDARMEWVELFDVRPEGVDAQLDLASGAITVRKRGVYTVSGSFGIVSTAATLIGVRVYINGVYELQGRNTDTTGVTTSAKVVEQLVLDEGDSLALFGYHNAPSEDYAMGKDYWNRLSIKFDAPVA